MSIEPVREFLGHFQLRDMRSMEVSFFSDHVKEAQEKFINFPRSFRIKQRLKQGCWFDTINEEKITEGGTIWHQTDHAAVREM